MGESAGEGGNQEGVKAIAGIVELLRRCLAGSHNAGTLRKKEEKKNHWEWNCAADLPFKKSGAIISIQMTALCRSIHNQS